MEATRDGIQGTSFAQKNNNNQQKKKFACHTRGKEGHKSPECPGLMSSPVVTPAVLEVRTTQLTGRRSNNTRSQTETGWEHQGIQVDTDAWEHNGDN